MPSHPRHHHGLALACALAALLAWFTASPAQAHGFSSVVYATVTAPERGHVRAELALEYDLLVVSAADAQHDDALFQDGTAAFDDGDPTAQAGALDAHAATVLGYVAPRFTVASGGQACTPAQVGDVTVAPRDGVPYVTLVLDLTCPVASGSHEVTSTLFPDTEGYVRGTRTIVTYDLDLQHGSAALDAGQPSFSTEQSTVERFWEFFKLGAEHLLGGLDHILFLLAVIAGSRRLREIVLAATTFTLAHSVTFILAATGLVHVSAAFVEPTIALSIAVVAGWHLWQIRRRGVHAGELEVAGGPFSLDRAGWVRLGVVFCFGLVHGLGFAGALGIDEPWSWALLWSLLVFNVGLEVVQLGIIAVVFPLLSLLRHRSARAGLWATGTLSAVVAAMGLLWFVERVTGA
ncbi:HupE/UreJ family protein [Cellulomonas citrea]|uniref:HupE/UreJ family protein n=1 Tax=Cellulomonas citrea TaxID=1909423 RepID=UPI001357BC8B|nr:HupE/UreJ family protein [Cellulomonas citrea]